MTQHPQRTALAPTSSIRLRGTKENVIEARRFTVKVLRKSATTTVPDDVVERAELLVSELTTNAIQHTMSGEGNGTFVLVLSVESSRVRATVRTDEPREPSNVPQARHSSALSESGRGLALVDMLSDEWGPLPWPERGVYFLITWPEDDLR